MEILRPKFNPYASQRGKCILSAGLGKIMVIVHSVVKILEQLLGFQRQMENFSAFN